VNGSYRRFLRAAPALLVLGCAGDGASPDRVAVEVASLGLTDLSDAVYTVSVQGAGGVVWERQVASSRFGDGDGTLWLEAACDPEAGPNTVTLVLDALYDARGDVIDAARYRNPTPVSLAAPCGGTEAVAAFDVTVAGDANPGLFAAPVTFRDVVCSARLDCERRDTGATLELLNNPLKQGAKDQTAVLQVTCTGAAERTTRVYLDDPIIRCEGLDSDVVVDAASQGIVDLAAAPNHDPAGYLFAAAVNRDVQAEVGVAHWTVSLGLNDAAFATAGRCRLIGRATAMTRELALTDAGWELPSAAVYPVMVWDIDLTDASGRRCDVHELNGGNGMEIAYSGSVGGGAPNLFAWGPAPLCLRHRYAPATSEVVSALAR
jgi:hypothetical protein